MKLYGKCRLVYSWILMTAFLIPIISCGGNASTDSAATGTAPSTPIEVSATALGSMVTISWESVSGATSYSIYWGTSSGVTTSSETKITGIGFAVYTQTGLTNGTTYYYVVTANNSAGESLASGEVSATPESAISSLATYSVGGTVSGLTGTVVLQNNGGDDLTVTADGSFTFTTASTDGSAYAVTVLTQPSGAMCTATNDSGTVNGANVTSVSVNCVDEGYYSVGGDVCGLTGTLVLQNNSGNDLTLTADSSYTFTTAIADDAAYAVTVSTQPSGATCTITNGSGTSSDANVTNASIICEYAGGGTPGRTVLGVVRNVAGSALAGVTVEIFTDESAIVTGPSFRPSADGALPRHAALASATTDTNGSYIFSDVEVGNDYVMTYTLSDYIIVYMYDVDVTADATEYVETIRMVEESSSSGGASGTITNALTGDFESTATITLYSGLSNVSGTAISSITTNDSGAYSFAGLDAGNYTAQISKTDFTTSIFSIYVVGGSTTSDQNGAITPALSSGETRIILTWGETPYDLDSHLLGPYADGSDSQFHIYYANKTFTYSGSTYADLDLDDVSSYGPETTTIYNQSTGTYTFCVYDFSNGGSSSSTALADSGAQVNVYQGASHLGAFNVPNSCGSTVWKVFTLSDTTITPVNTMSYHSASSSSVCED